MDMQKEIRDEFKFIGCSASEDVIKTCAELCTTYGLSAEDIIEHWSAFTITNNNAALTVENVSLMERKELSAKKNLPSISNVVDKLGIKEGNKRVHSPELATDSKRYQYTPETIVASSSQSSTELDYLPEVSYVDRTDSGKVLLNFGSSNSVSPKTATRKDVSLKLYGKHSDWHIPDKFYFLYNTQKQISALYNAYVETMGKILLKKNYLDSPDLIDDTKNDVAIYGRIRSETDDKEKINGSAVRLEGTLRFNNGKNILLNISQTQSFSLIPGEVVAVLGSNIYGKAFIAHDVYNNALADFNSETPQWTDNMQIIVAAGPYTICNNISYQPLQDLLKYVVETRPDLLILLGPFIDTTQSSTMTMQETYDVHFENLIESIMGCFKGIHTKVVLIPSQNDAHHHPLYPCPSYDLKQKHPNLICAPDPCMIDINGLIIGVTNIDVLFHLSKQEISRKPKLVDRMSRLASHIINQRNFFPLYPPPKGVCIDYELLLSNCLMDVTPHVLIVPSMLRHFVKSVNQCLVVNPERLVKNYIGGSFAVINVAPAAAPGSMLDYLSCQIKKV